MSCKIFFAIAAALICGIPGFAHEIGTSRVSAMFQPNRKYEIQLVTDAQALAEKLRVMQGIPATSDTNPARLQSFIASSEGLFRRRVNIAFDGAEVRPLITYSVAPPTGSGAVPAATIRLTGEIPAKATQFTWNFGWTFASYALTLRNESSPNASTEWLEGGQASKPFALMLPPARVDRFEIAWRYLVLGFTHILPKGLDHMLFVLGIYLLSRRARTLLAQVSAFTIAHSITLGLSMYGLLNVPPHIVEPMIAVSIAYVAVENIFISELRSWRIALVFGFGLLHGMGFAGALKELGLPRSEFLTALVTFNAGVEAGQLAVIVAAFLLLGWYCAHRTWYRPRVVLPASAAIAATAVYWTIQRL